MGTRSNPIQAPRQPKPRRVLRTFKRVLIVLLASVAVIVAIAVVWLYRHLKEALPQLDGAVSVAGLHAPVEVLRDQHGVPHLRAQSLEDLFFAQGYVTAQDRLFQMDLSRRLAMGQLSEILGKSTLRFDTENRTLGFPEVTERAAQELDPASRKLMDAYSAGVNAFIASHRDRLPIEFALLRYEPRPWRNADSFGVALNMSKSLNNTWRDELMREEIRARVSPELYADLFPNHSDLDHPVAELDRSRTRPRRPEKTGVLQDPQDGRRKSTPAADRSPEMRGPVVPIFAALLAPGPNDAADLGSNNWVVSGAHTKSGKPLLANDPHLSHSIPSVWYMIHLEAPGLDVSGVSLPGLPLVIIGHNQRIAWGMTNTGPDVQDIYAETFDPKDRNKYLHNNEWVKAEVRQETIHVRGDKDVSFQVKATRHGPVISHEGSRDLALRWTALEPGALRFPFLKIDRAQNWQEFTAALRDFTGPMQNFVYADVDGNVGYYAAAWVPIRKEGDGSLPPPGSTDDYDWTGYIPFEDLPHAFNPASGMIATANGRIVPDGYPYFITDRWAAPFRTARIFQLLESGKEFTVSDMLRIQTDILSLEDKWLAGELVKAAKAHAPSTPDAQYAMSLLADYDGEAHADSAATLVCEVTRKALLKRILTPKLGDEVSDYNWSMSTIFLMTVLKNNWTRWLPPGDQDFNATLMKSLEEGVAHIPSLVGSPDHAAWQWGQTIPLTFHNRLTLAFPFLAKYLNVGPVPQPGTQTTVKQTTPTVGPSMRMVVDFSNLDNSVQNITVGESGQVMSGYYKDQFDAWYHGRSFPMQFSDDAVSKGARHKLLLEPAPGAGSDPASQE
jgi:penicillin G amidase